MNRVWNSSARYLIGGVIFVLVVGLFAIGAYMMHGWSFADSLYMVVITIFTVGYEEVRPIDTPGLRDVTMMLVVLGCTGMIFLTGALVQFITISEIQKVLGTKRMQNQIAKLSDHVIICGFGRIGNMLARELSAARVGFIVIERSESRLNEARALNYLVVEGDATEESTLSLANVSKARALATVLPNDAANVFITLSARSLNRGLMIIARGESPSTESKLLQAGANEVVLPAHIGAERVAEMILYQGTARIMRRSATMKQMEHELHRLGLEIEVVVAAAGSAFAGRSVEEIEQAAELAFMIVAVEPPGSDAAERPQPRTIVQPGDGVMIIGRSGRARAVSGFSQT